MKIRKFNSEGLERWKNFYNELFFEIKRISEGKITAKDILKGYSADFKKKYEMLKKFRKRIKNILQHIFINTWIKSNQKR